MAVRPKASADQLFAIHFHFIFRPLIDPFCLAVPATRITYYAVTTHCETRHSLDIVNLLLKTAAAPAAFEGAPSPSLKNYSCAFRSFPLGLPPPLIALLLTTMFAASFLSRCFRAPALLGVRLAAAARPSAVTGGSGEFRLKVVN